jgi:hypothetical protein
LPIKLYTYQRGIEAAIGDPRIERVSVMSARIGYTAPLTSASPISSCASRRRSWC